MMKLISSSNGFKCQSHPQLSRVLTVFFYSTKTPNSKPKTLPSKSSNDILYKRISPVGDPRVSMVPILEQWVKEGKTVEKYDLVNIARQLRQYKRFRHALDVSQWMSDRRYFHLSPADAAVRLDLISKVHGLEKAEEYFDNLPKQLKLFQTYGALLNCYAHWKSVEKAEALMQKMRELGFARTSLSYNVLLKLYFKVGQHEKIDALMEEMKEKAIGQDKFTLNIQLSGYADTGNIDGMEGILQKMEADSKVDMDWVSYLVASKGYTKAGLIDKALEMLKKSEGLIPRNRRRLAYESLLSSYAGIGRKDEVYRIWNLYKSLQKLYNTAYSCMLISLLKLDDIEGAEKIYQEWECEGTSYDFRITNILILAYCRNGLVEKAETIIKNNIEKCKEPYANTWGHLAAGYVEAGRISEAVEAMKKAISLKRHWWKPKRDTLTACLDFLKEKGDSEEINEFAKLLGVSGSDSVYERLLNCADVGKHISGTVHDEEALDDNEDTDQMQETKVETVSD